MKRIISLFAAAALLTVSCQKQESMEELTARVFERAAAQFVLLDSNMDAVAAEKPGAEF